MARGRSPESCSDSDHSKSDRSKSDSSRSHSRSGCASMALSKGGRSPSLSGSDCGNGDPEVLPRSRERDPEGYLCKSSIYSRERDPEACRGGCNCSDRSFSPRSGSDAFAEERVHNDGAAQAPLDEDECDPEACEINFFKNMRARFGRKSQKTPGWPRLLGGKTKPAAVKEIPPQCRVEGSISTLSPWVPETQDYDRPTSHGTFGDDIKLPDRDTSYSRQYRAEDSDTEVQSEGGHRVEKHTKDASPRSGEEDASPPTADSPAEELGRLAAEERVHNDGAAQAPLDEDECDPEACEINFFKNMRVRFGRKSQETPGWPRLLGGKTKPAAVKEIPPQCREEGSISTLSQWVPETQDYDRPTSHGTFGNIKQPDRDPSYSRQYRAEDSDTEVQSEGGHWVKKHTKDASPRSGEEDASPPTADSPAEELGRLAAEALGPAKQLRLDTKKPDEVKSIVWRFPKRGGAEVKRLNNEMPADMGIRPGDVLTSINGQSVVGQDKEQIESLWKEAQRDSRYFEIGLRSRRESRTRK